MTEVKSKSKYKYEVILKLGNKSHKVNANSVAEALGKFELKWHQVKIKGEVTVKKGRKKYTHLFYVPTLKHIFANKLTRQLWGRRLEYLLGEV